MGPLLFIIYMNDFEHCLQGTVLIMYADDTSITCSSTDSPSLQSNIEIEMANVAEWMRQNRLSLNANKIEFMVIRHSRQHNNLDEVYEIEVNQEKIGGFTKTKYLGLNIDENLSWNDQWKRVKLRLKVASLHFRDLETLYLSQS